MSTNETGPRLPDEGQNRDSSRIPSQQDQCTALKGTASAKAMAAKGYRVHPVKHDKNPYLPGWPDKATTNPDEIEKFWASHPGAGVGIATGEGLVVIDLDVKNDKDGVAEFVKPLGPETVDWNRATSTPSDGAHVYYRTDEAFGNATNVLPGVDVRGERGYVVAYDPDVPALADLPELPRAVAEILRKKAPERATGVVREVTLSKARAALDRERGDVRNAPEGERNNALNTAAFNLGQLIGEPGLDEGEVRDTLTEAAETAGLGAVETAKTIDSGLRKGMANPRVVVPEDPADDFGPSAGHPGGGEPGDSWVPVDIAALLAGDLEPLEPTLMARSDGKCLLYPGRTHSLAGESGSGKSWVAQWVTACALRDGGDVLYLDYESNAKAVLGRLRALGCPDEALFRLVYLNPGEPPAGDAFKALLSRGFALAVVDGVNEALNTSGLTGESLSNSNDAVTKWHRALPKRVAEKCGAAVLMVDHVTKDAGTRGAYAIGAQAKRATVTGAAYTVEVEEPLGRGKTGRLKLFVTKDREGYVQGVAGEVTSGKQPIGVMTFASDGDRVTVDLGEPPAGPGGRGLELERGILALLEKLPEGHEGLTTRGICESVTGDDKKIRDALNRLVGEGRVTREFKGRSQLHKINKSAAEFEVLGEPPARSFMSERGDSDG